jgi:hypothetical protein
METYTIEPIRQSAEPGFEELVALMKGMKTLIDALEAVLRESGDTVPVINVDAEE